MRADASAPEFLYQIIDGGSILKSCFNACLAESYTLGIQQLYAPPSVPQPTNLSLPKISSSVFFARSPLGAVDAADPEQPPLALKGHLRRCNSRLARWLSTACSCLLSNNLISLARWSMSSVSHCFFLRWAAWPASTHTNQRHTICQSWFPLEASHLCSVQHVLAWKRWSEYPPLYHDLVM
jgi:hypothetical protein